MNFFPQEEKWEAWESRDKKKGLSGGESGGLVDVSGERRRVGCRKMGSVRKHVQRDGGRTVWGRSLTLERGTETSRGESWGLVGEWKPD